MVASKTLDSDISMAIVALVGSASFFWNPSCLHILVLPKRGGRSLGSNCNTLFSYFRYFLPASILKYETESNADVSTRLVITDFFG